MTAQSESIVKLSAALVAAQAAMPVIPKASTGQVGSQRTKYADLADVVEKIRPVLAAHKLAFVQFLTAADPGSLGMTTRLLHESGEWIEGTFTIPAGNTAQQLGSAATYGRRYGLLALLGVVADEDDDGAAASARPRQPARREPAAQPDAAEEVVARIAAASPAVKASLRGIDREHRGFTVEALQDPEWRGRVKAQLEAVPV